MEITIVSAMKSNGSPSSTMSATIFSLSKSKSSNLKSSWMDTLMSLVFIFRMKAVTLVSAILPINNQRYKFATVLGI